MKKYGIVNLEMGVATLNVAAEDFQQPKDNFYSNSPFYLRSLSGIRKDGVSTFTFATPAGSFFVPSVARWGKSRKTLNVGGRLMPYRAQIANELRTAVRCSKRVALRATRGTTENRKKDLNRIYAETLTANVLTIAEEIDLVTECNGCVTECNSAAVGGKNAEVIK